MDHICEYCAEHRDVDTDVDTKYNSTKKIVTLTTSICVQVYEFCGKSIPKTPTEEFIMMRSYYSYELIIGNKFVEQDDVCTE